MKVILLKDVPKIGKKYDIKNISPGYAQNMLIPQKSAIIATPDSIKQIELIKMKEDGNRKVQEELLIKNLKELAGVTINLSLKANDKGHLFAGLHKEDFSREIEKQTKISVPPSFISLEHPIKTIGEYDIEIVAQDKKGSVKVVIEAVK